MGTIAPGAGGVKKEPQVPAPLLTSTTAAAVFLGSQAERLPFEQDQIPFPGLFETEQVELIEEYSGKIRKKKDRSDSRPLHGGNRTLAETPVPLQGGCRNPQCCPESVLV